MQCTIACMLVVLLTSSLFTLEAFAFELSSQKSGSKIQSNAPYPPSFYQGEITSLVVPVEFSDNKSRFKLSEIRAALNQKNYAYNGPIGSVHDYYRRLSGGKVNLKFIVTDFYQAKHKKSHYDGGAGIIDLSPSYALTEEVLGYLKKIKFDFSKISKYPDGLVRSILIVYAGDAKEFMKGLWPHVDYYPADLSINGAKIGSPKEPLRWNLGMVNLGSVSIDIKNLIHELGHAVFNWPDTYDVGGESKGIGEFDKVANPYFRNVWCGWGEIKFLNELPQGTKVSIPANQVGAYVYVGTDPREYFMVEYVRRDGIWSLMPAQGLLIWHVDTRKNDNEESDRKSEKHYMISLEQADGLFELEKTPHLSAKGLPDDKDLFYAPYKTRFTESTVPNSNWWNGKPSGLRLTNIGTRGKSMRFTYEGKMFSQDTVKRMTQTTVQKTITDTKQEKVPVVNDANKTKEIIAKQENQEAPVFSNNEAAPHLQNVASLHANTEEPGMQQQHATVRISSEIEKNEKEILPWMMAGSLSFIVVFSVLHSLKKRKQVTGQTGV